MSEIMLHSCGIDEVGRGPLAGPVVAACVHIPANVQGMHFWKEVTDSKLLTRPQRKQLYKQIAENSIWAVGLCSVTEIDALNIFQASLLAMTRAYTHCCEKIPYRPLIARIDGKFIPVDFPGRAEAVIKGDSLYKDISAASIIAKVTRDQMMTELHEMFPFYSWDTNSGYYTEAHQLGIQKQGITPHHRRSFAPVKNYLKQSAG